TFSGDARNASSSDRTIASSMGSDYRSADEAAGAEHFASARHAGLDVSIPQLGVEEAGERGARQVVGRPDLDDRYRAATGPAHRGEHLVELPAIEHAAVGQLAEPADAIVDLLGLAKVAVETLADEHLGEMAAELDAVQLAGRLGAELDR